MKIYNEINTQGLFTINGKEYAGVLTTKPDSPITIKIVVSEKNNIEPDVSNDFEIELIEESIQKLPFVYGVLKDEKKLVTLIDAVMYSSYFSTDGIYEYTVKSNLIIFDIHIDAESKFEIDNISLVAKPINLLIGNSNLRSQHNIKDNKWILEIEDKKLSCLGNTNDLNLKLNSFYNFGKFSLRQKVIIEQINTLEFTFSLNKDMYDIIGFIRNIENYLSFIFQKDLGIDEVVFYTEYKNNPEMKLSHYIYYYDSNKSNNEVQISDCIVSSSNRIDIIGLYLLNWIRFSDQVPYLKYFIRLFFSTKYIDQRIIGQICCIEALHAFYFGTKKKSEENKELVNEILAELKTDRFNELISNLLLNSTGYGLTRKISDMATKSNVIIPSKKVIKEINNLRQKSLHGSGKLDFDINQYQEMQAFLNSIIHKIIIDEISRTEL